MPIFTVFGTYYNVPDRRPDEWSINEFALSRPLTARKALELARREAFAEYERGFTCLSVRIVCKGKTVWQWYHN